eukprot:scpid81102/ scgid33477/ 
MMAYVSCVALFAALSLHSAPVLALPALPVSDWKPVSYFTHGWDCIACETNSMLAGDFGHSSESGFNLSDSWWVSEVAKYYAAVSINHWKDSREYNGTGENRMVTVGRALRAANPKLKILYYQALDRGDLAPYGANVIQAHKDWWLKNDNGDVIWFDKSKQHPVLDLRVKEAQVWFVNLTISYFRNPEEAKDLCDGLFFDAAAYINTYRHDNFSDKSYDELFLGRMETMRMAQQLFTEMNKGEVWGNPSLPIWTPPPASYHGAPWNYYLQHFNGAFDPWFGSFAVLNKDGSWNVRMMELTFETVINASNAGHSMILHAFPGPATAPFSNRGTGDNVFRVAKWLGKTPVPEDPAAVRQAAADLLVQSLAPFLIVANERVFFSYGWFWNIEDGYIPCSGNIECGMPSTWYKEFGQPLGNPKGAALRNGTVWTRQFEHASVYVDLADRTKCRVDWS